MSITTAAEFQKGRILSLMRDRALDQPRRKGWVGLTTRDISRDLAIPEHDVTHALYDLRKQGLIQFHESKSQARARRRGTESVGSTPRGGIPVRIRVTAALDESVFRRFLGAEPPVNGHAQAVAPTDLDGGAQPDEKDEPVETDGEQDDEPVLSVHSDGLLTDLPLIGNLRNRNEAMTRAADLLASVGEDAAAGLVRESIETMSRLDREVVTLLRRLEESGLLGEADG